MLMRRGIVAAFKRPGGCMTRIVGGGEDVWWYRWMVKTIGAVSGAAASTCKRRCVLVFLEGGGVGSQAERSQRQVLVAGHRGRDPWLGARCRVQSRRCEGRLLHLRS